MLIHGASKHPLSEQDTHIKLGVTKTSPAHRCQTEGITHPSTQQTGSSLCPVSVLHIACLLWALVQNSGPALSQTLTQHNTYTPGPLAVTPSCPFSSSPQAVSACLSPSPPSGTWPSLMLGHTSSSVTTVPFLKSLLWMCHGPAWKFHF